MLPDNQSQTDKTLLHERIRQARWGFNLLIGFVGSSLLITFVGVILLLAGRISQGAYATLGGLASTGVSSRSVQLSREANDRLDRMAQKLDDESNSE
jgi:hypothetical protein